MAFNPARAISQLREGGHSETQAQTVVEVIHDSHEELSTKQDLEQLRLSTKQDLEHHRLSTKADLEQLRLAMQADLREQTAELNMHMGELKIDMGELKIWTLKLVLAQTALMITIAVGAVVVGGVLWG